METIEQQTRKIISKQGTATLVSKLEKGTLLGISKDMALEVLKKRGTPFTQEGAENTKPKGWTKNGEVGKETDPREESFENEAPKIEEKVKTAKKVEIKKEKVKTEPVEQSIEVSALIKAEGSKSDKIRNLSKKGLTVLEISKIKELCVSYQFVRGVVKKIKDEQSK